MTYPGQVGRAIFSIHETYGHNTCVHMYIHPLPLAHIPSVHACTHTYTIHVQDFDVSSCDYIYYVHILGLAHKAGRGPDFDQHGVNKEQSWMLPVSTPARVDIRAGYLHRYKHTQCSDDVVRTVQRWDAVSGSFVPTCLCTYRKRHLMAVKRLSFACRWKTREICHRKSIACRISMDP